MRDKKKQQNIVEVRNLKIQTEKINFNKGSQTEVKLQETAKKSENMIADKKTVAKNNKKKKRILFCFFFLKFELKTLFLCFNV